MSELRSAIDALRAEVLTELPDARAEEEFAEVQRAFELIEAERLRRLADLERRRVFERDGYLSAASWLASTFGLAWGSARSDVSTASALEEMPKTRRALEEGEVSLSAARVLVSAREADPAAFAQSEGRSSKPRGSTPPEISRGSPPPGRAPWMRSTPSTGTQGCGPAGGSARSSGSSGWCA